MSGNETIVLGPGGSADPEDERIRNEIFAGLIDRLNAGEAIDAVTGKDQVSIGFARDLGSDHIVNLGDGITIALGAETPDGRDLLA